jgi:Flp pilus assembly protein TadD
LAGVVHLARQAAGLVVALNVNRRFDGATAELLDGSSMVFHEQGDFLPEKTWTRQIPLRDASHKYSFVLKDQQGRVLLSQTEDSYDWAPESEVKVGPQENYRFPEESRRSEDDWLQLGKTQELDGDLLSARRTYQNALAKFPTSFELSKAAGRLDAALLRFDEASERLGAAKERDTTDAEVSYYLGLAQDGLGNTEAAAAAYGAALLAPGERAAAALRLAELRARQGRWHEASRLIGDTLQAAPDDLRAMEAQVVLIRAAGEPDRATRQAKEWLQHYPLSALLKEEAGQPDLKHLAADPYRVLRLASEYASLGLYRRAVEILSRDYPAVDADRSEPGMTLPQRNPLLVYFRGFCREKAGESAAKDYEEASRMPTLYVFPSTNEDRLALEAALRSNPQDATAHYLLGNWYFARAKTPEALREWSAARERDRKIPALEASLGLALFHETRDFGRAFEAFHAGIADDSQNVVNYSGAADAMTLLGKSAEERVKEIERYPDPRQMPNVLVYELALSRAEARDYDRAASVFSGRFFSREEGGTNVRQVWIEIRLQQALGLAEAKRCKDALNIAEHLGEPVAGLSFTQDGLKTFMDGARTRYLLGEVYDSCGGTSRAAQLFSQVSPAAGTSDLVWAWAAARKSSNFAEKDWRERLSKAAQLALERTRQGNHEGWWQYTAGILLIAAGQPDGGNRELRESILSPDENLSHYLARLALAGSTPR